MVAVQPGDDATTLVMSQCHSWPSTALRVMLIGESKVQLLSFLQYSTWLAHEPT